MLKSSLQKKMVVLLISVLSFSAIFAQINFSTKSSYKYLKGSDAQSIASNWYSVIFDDNGWVSANAPFRYGDGSGGTELTDMKGNYSTVFLRSTFTVTNIDLLGEISIGADWDDGFILWINGIQVLSQQAPLNVLYNALASDQHESGTPEYFKYNANELGLIEGENTLAVLACNITLDESSDFYFDMSIRAQANTPEVVDTLGLKFSHNSGFYNSNFDLSITTAVAGASVVYTLDGSNPQTSLTSISKGSSATININPTSISDRAATPAVIVRASIVKEGYKASKPEARTFIYLDKVKTQSHPGGNWPTYNVNDQHIDLDMDANVVNSDQYKNQMDAALLDIPSISVITDNANLFDPQIGIYVNALEQGEEWERECSVELINPDGSDGFNVNAGLRIRGGWSRHDNYPKHAFRLFFREAYGNSKLYFPLFGDEGVDHFDKVDLRCAQNYSWSNGEGIHNTFIREVFLRDAQGETGQPYTRSRYYHLYLNGMYWGMFQSQERSEARYASDYFGGDNDDWDILKIGGYDNKNIVPTDGNLDKWREVWNITQKGYQNNANYFLLEGKNADGKPMRNSEILVDIDNLIDYMINIFYAGNFDSPVSIWGGNNSPNNLYIIKNREDKTRGFQFLIHDAEHTMMMEGTSGPGTIGLYENRVNLAYRDDAKMVSPGFDTFHTQWLHHTLTKNEEYKVRFADLAYKRLSNEGIFTENANIERLNKRAQMIENAIIAESARWGDTQHYPAFTKTNWEEEVDILRNEYFTQRTDIVIDQLLEYGLYPEIEAPKIKLEEVELFDEVIYINKKVSISFEATSDIYYTKDGTDPRAIGGEPSSSSIKINSGNSVSVPSSAVFKVRALKNNKWSGLREVKLVNNQTDYSNFKITELHYHPLDSIYGTDTIEGGDFEFIEFKNTSYSEAINLSGLIIDSAIYYEFPEDYILAPQEYFVVAAKPAKFYARYGMEPSGNFKNSLSNGGEQVVIHKTNGDIVMDFIYDDHDPWNEEPDGDGPSLIAENINPTGDPNAYYYWTASSVIHGTPFAHKFRVGAEDVLASNPMDNILLYPNPTTDVFNVKLSANNDANFTLNIYNIKGQLLFANDYTHHAEVSLTALNINYGVYFVKIKSATNTVTQKLIYTPF